MARPRYARPVTTRSVLVFQIAEELARDNTWPYQQGRVVMRPQGGDAPGVSLFGSDSPEAIDLVARGEVQLAIVNPAAPLTLAYRGTGPFKEAIPVRTIAVIHSRDAFAFAVSEKSGITSLRDIKERKYPLRVTLRGQRDHANHFLERVVLGEYGITYEDIEAWGGQVRFDPGLPTGTSTSGADIAHSRIDLAREGAVDAIFDEAVGTWVGLALDAGMRILSLEEPMVQKLEAMGFRRSILAKSQWPKLPADALSLDFSGWPIYTHANVPDDVVRAFCAALEARKDRIPWQGEGPLPLDRMCKDSPEGPLDVPLHPAAEQFWRERGYL
ncbi:MAG TPA: TAXI family TRAP transporter solute-binding subunit [Chloroflexota bacterium]|nr:TAXI family TRAP transporter solute-binding subunit [Chloroflexota bacterium]